MKEGKNSLFGIFLKKKMAHSANFLLKILMKNDMFYTMGHFSHRMNYFQNYIFLIREGSPKKPHHNIGSSRKFGIQPVSD
jgi:hypothetical protein